MSKKPELKKQEAQQEPPAEQPPMQEEDPVRPMAVQPPTLEERVEALELRLKVTEEWTGKHNRYHFGKLT